MEGVDKLTTIVSSILSGAVNSGSTLASPKTEWPKEGGGRGVEVLLFITCACAPRNGREDEPEPEESLSVEGCIYSCFGSGGRSKTKILEVERGNFLLHRKFVVFVGRFKVVTT